ncbi:hypothetical protein KAX17_06030 [Candidatus Bipolaricaulota bacterium]|nr:hypothetical protein [Candidatus Bipolaricaulota bacterium]
MRAIDRCGTIVVELEGARELFFRYLSVSDEEFLQMLVREHPPPRDFTLRLLENQVLESSPTQPSALDDNELATAAFSWADQDRSIRQEAPGQKRSLAAFKQRIALHVEETEAALRELARKLYPDVERSLAQMRRAATAVSPAVLQSIDELVRRPEQVARSIRETITAANERFAAIGQALFNPVLRTAVLAVEEQGRLIRELATAASRQIEAISHSLTVAIPTLDLVRGLPSAREIVEAWERHKLAVDEGGRVLDEEGFCFVKSLVGTRLAVRLAGIPEQVRGAQTTNKLLSFTKSEPFHLALETRVNSSEVAKRRWHIVEQALAAHSCRNYVLSVPALFAQVEGLFTDSMIINNLATTLQGKVCALDPAGNVKLNCRGDPVRLNGLGHKVQHSPYQNHDVLREVVAILVQSLTGKRNGVLHGSDTAYGRAKLSTQLMLLVFILATEILGFERGNVTP